MPPKLSPRLERIDRILSQSPAPMGARVGAGREQVHLDSVPLERIQALTVELDERSPIDADEIDAITLRLLLNDYRVAVGHLRAVANSVDARLHAAGQEIHDTRKMVRREEEMAMKREAKADAD